MPQLNAISNEIIIVKEPTDELHLVDPEVEEETRVQSGRLFFFFLGFFNFSPLWCCVSLFFDLLCFQIIPASTSTKPVFYLQLMRLMNGV